MNDGANHPFPDFKRLGEMFDRFFEDPFPEPFFKSSFRVDVYDLGDELVIEAELPGFSRDQIKLEFVQQGLMITAEHTESSNMVNDKTKVVRKERAFRKAQRLIPLPGFVDLETVKAKYTNGILEVRIKKKHQSGESHAIPIE